MQNSVLKLTALAGVVSIGFLGVLHAQRGMNRQAVVSAHDTQAAGTGSTTETVSKPVSSALDSTGDETATRVLRPESTSDVEQIEPGSVEVASTDQSGYLTRDTDSSGPPQSSDRSRAAFEVVEINEPANAVASATAGLFESQEETQPANQPPPTTTRKFTRSTMPLDGNVDQLAQVDASGNGKTPYEYAAHGGAFSVSDAPAKDESAQAKDSPAPMSSSSASPPSHNIEDIGFDPFEETVPTSGTTADKTKSPPNSGLISIGEESPTLTTPGKPTATDRSHNAGTQRLEYFNSRNPSQPATAPDAGGVVQTGFNDVQEDTDANGADATPDDFQSIPTEEPLQAFGDELNEGAQFDFDPSDSSDELQTPFVDEFASPPTSEFPAGADAGQFPPDNRGGFPTATDPDLSEMPVDETFGSPEIEVEDFFGDSSMESSPAADKAQPASGFDFEPVELDTNAAPQADDESSSGLSPEFAEELPQDQAEFSTAEPTAETPGPEPFPTVDEYEPTPFGAEMETEPTPSPQADPVREAGPTFGEPAPPETPAAVEPSPASEPTPEPARLPAAASNVRILEREAFEDAGDRTPQRAASEPKPNASPQRLQPPPEASRLTPVSADDLKGVGTVRTDAPLTSHRPALKIQKTAPPNAILGQPMIYNILVTNTGQAAAHQVVVEDEIPKGSQLQGTIPRAELIDKRLVWRLGTIGPGAERKISIRVVPTSEGQIGSVATVNFVAEVAAQTLITAPRLRVDLSAPKQVSLGDPVVLNFKVSNDGTGEAKGVFLRDLIPDGLRHPDGNDLEYEVGTLAAGKSLDVKLTLVATKPGTVINRVVITADGGLSTEARAKVEVIGSQFSVTRSGPSRAIIGRATTYTNTISNDFDNLIKAATVVETLPEGVEFVEATDGGSFDPDKRLVIWHLDDVEARQKRALRITVIPQAAGPYESTVKVADTFGGQAEVVAKTDVIGFASLSIGLADVDGTLAIGEGASVKLRIRNRGSVPAHNVVVRLVMPPQMQLVSAAGPVEYKIAGAELVFDAIPVIAPDAEEVLEVALTAHKPGDARLRFLLQSSEMKVPLAHDESIIVFAVGQ